MTSHNRSHQLEYYYHNKSKILMNKKNINCACGGKYKLCKKKIHESSQKHKMWRKALRLRLMNSRKINNSPFESIILELKID